MNIVMRFGGTDVRAVLNQTQTARAFASRLPVTIPVSGTGLDFCGKIPFSLPYEKSQVHCGWQDGDVNYNPEGGWFAILHSGQDESGAYDDQVVMGRIEGEDLEKVRGLRGSFDIVIELED